MKKLCRILLGIMVVWMLTACGKNVEQQVLEQLELGQKYLSELNYAEAIVTFSKVIELDEKNTKAYLGRGQAYILSGETEENLTLALADFDKVLALDDIIAEAWLGKADVLIRQGKYEEAMELLKEALEKTGGASSISEKLEEMKGGIYKDSSEKLRRQNSYDAFGELIWYHTYTYDQDGQMDTATSYDSKSIQTSYVDLIYEKGKPLVSFHYLNDTGKLIRREYKYEADMCVEALIFEEGGLEREVFSYNEENICVAVDYYNQDNVIKERQEMIIGKNNRTDARYHYVYEGDNKRLRNYTIMEYDENDRLSVESTFDNESVLYHKKVYVYDEDKPRIEYFDGKGNLQSVTYYE